MDWMDSWIMRIYMGKIRIFKTGICNSTIKTIICKECKYKGFCPLRKEEICNLNCTNIKKMQ